MNGLLIAILGLGVVLPLGAGFAIGAYRAAQNPAFYGEAAAIFGRAFLPLLLDFLKRNDPETEKRMNEVLRRGGQWDNARKRELRREH
jgi:hypothetical protein